MIRTTSAFSALSLFACTTNRIEPGAIAPRVMNRSSSSCTVSRFVRAYGSSNTSVAVSKLTSCFRRFVRFFSSSQSKDMLACS